MKYRKNLVLFSLFALNLVDQPTPPVVIEQGTLTGNVNGDGTILEYIGIPYGTVNSTNRFQGPYPPPKWEGIFKATEESVCPQTMSVLGVGGSEDCLKVNVYVPVRPKKPLPVMVFIHGGGFRIGSGGKLCYRPEFLVKHDVILVTFNYRLGILGFLCLGIKEAPGNAGLKDQIAALRWIKKNIAAFGGDPDNVTIFGESAGAASVSLLHASSATEGLFQKAIVQSGSSMSSWSVNRNPVWIASLVAKALGHNTQDPKELYNIFHQIPYKELVAVEAKKPLGLYFDTQLLHLPCVERAIPGVEPAIDDLPYNLLTKKTKNIPMIFGFNTIEGLFVVVEESDENLQAQNEKYLFASDLTFPSEEEAAVVDKRLKKFFFGDKRISKAVRDNVTNLYTQLYFETPELIETEVILKSSNKPVYNYIFNYSGGRNFLKWACGVSNETGAVHGDEVLYLFNANVWPYPISKRDQKIIDWMTKLWTNFAKYGNPSPSPDDPIKWEPSTQEQLKFLWIDDQLSMGPMLNPEGYQMWKKIYDKYRKTVLKDYLPVIS